MVVRKGGEEREGRERAIVGSENRESRGRMGNVGREGERRRVEGSWSERSW